MLLFVTLFPYFHFEAISKGFNLVALPWILEQESSRSQSPDLSISVSCLSVKIFISACVSLNLLLIEI